MKLFSLVRGLRGKGMDEVLELCQSMGFDVKVTPVPEDKKPQAEQLGKLADAATSDGAKVLLLEWKSGDSEGLAFMVTRDAVIKTS